MADPRHLSVQMEHRQAPKARSALAQMMIEYPRNVFAGKYLNENISRMMDDYNARKASALAQMMETGRIKPLGMDQGSYDTATNWGMPAIAGTARLVRAAKMGFRTDEPVYHGMSGPLEGGAFDLGRGGATSGSQVGSLGVSLAHDPAVADEFANLAGREGANVIPAFYRAEKRATIEIDPSMTNFEVAGAVMDAWDAGYDAIKFTNYSTEGGLTGKTFVMVKNPAQIRSVMAKFNPKKKDSGDILAGLVAAGVLVPAAMDGDK